MGASSDSALIRFSVKLEVSAQEQVFLTGNCKELGNWIHEDAVPLKHADKTADSYTDVENAWSVVVALPFNAHIQYRYFVGTYYELPTGRRVLLIRHYESHIAPREVTTPAEQTGSVFESDPQNPVEYGPVTQRGWLTSESEIHLRCMSKAIHWWKARHRTKAHSMKVVPMDLRYRENAQEEEDDLSSPCADDLEMAVLKKDQCRYHQQPKYGRIFKPDDIVLYRMRVLEPSFMAFRCDFYAYEAGTEEENVFEGGVEPRHVGCSYILPTNMKDTYGERTVLINGMKHQPIGQLFVHYMLIQPTLSIGCSLRISFAKYWRKREMGYDIGHRGSGNSFSVKTQCAGIRENTIASLASAAANGADFVEFDVQLSKDKVPVIYHDFTVFITMRRRHGSGDSISSTSSVGSNGGDSLFGGELYEMPVKDLTLQQLHMLKLNHITEKDGQTKYNVQDDHQPFPSLEKALRVLDKDVGFNVEVKFPLAFMDGKHEAENFFERNEFVDQILRVVYQHAGNRRIIFSCFDPDTCLMLRVKQNKYPVSYLTHGEATMWPQYVDPRTHTTRSVFFSAIAYDLIGVNVHTSNLLSNEWLIQEAKSAGLIVIVWGDENNDAATIKHLKAIGVDGIIYDRIEEFKTDKDNVFRLEYRAKRTLIDQLSRDSIISTGN